MHPDHLEPPLLVFGGPCSNLGAVLAMRKRAAELGMTGSRCIYTGDDGGYCAEPEETIAAIRDGLPCGCG